MIFLFSFIEYMQLNPRSPVLLSTVQKFSKNTLDRVNIEDRR